MRNPWVVAHRGASGSAPENTLAAFRRAIHLGARFIETDLRLTRDGRLVAIHDELLDRTTTGRGPVGACTLEEIRSLDAGSWFGPEFAGERVPTIEEILQLARDADVVFYLEMKAQAGWGGEHAVVAALRASQEAARTLVLSFDPGALETLRRLDPILMSGLLTDNVGVVAPDPVATALRVGARQVAPRADLVTPELIERAHGEGLQVVTWTANDPDHMRALIAAGVDGIMTDYPERLVRVVSESRE